MGSVGSIGEVLQCVYFELDNTEVVVPYTLFAFFFFFVAFLFKHVQIKLLHEVIVHMTFELSGR